jgi:hypothetical protein
LPAVCEPFALLLFGVLPAYGPAPGVELIPYFLGLLAWAGLALSAIFLSPITALLRRLRRGRAPSEAQPKPEPTGASAPEPPGEGSRDSA